MVLEVNPQGAVFRPVRAHAGPVELAPAALAVQHPGGDQAKLFAHGRNDPRYLGSSTIICAKMMKKP
jgi:hypothetical protein